MQLLHTALTSKFIELKNKKYHIYYIFLLSLIFAAQLAYLTWIILLLIIESPLQHTPASISAKKKYHQNNQWNFLVKQQSIPIINHAPTNTQININAQLQATIVLSPNNGIVWISIDRGQAQLYTTGDTIVDNIIVKNVELNKVILEQGNNITTLVLPEKIINFDVKNVYPQATVRNSLNTIKTLIQQDPAQLTKKASLQPEYQNSRLVGYKINIKQDQQLFDTLGLQSEDIIKSINGMDLQKLLQTPSELNKLSDKQQFNIIIDRHGSSQTLTLKLD